MKIYQSKKVLKLIFLFILILFLVWRITISDSLIRGRKYEKYQPVSDRQNTNMVVDEQHNKGTLLTEEDRKLGVVAITEREEYPTYIIPAMVKLIPRETTLGVKDEHVTGIPGEILGIMSLNPPGYGDIRRTVKLKTYWIGCYEVTLQEFEKFLKDTNQRGENILVDGARQVKPNRPVVGIHRRLAIEYCEWLSKKTGMKFRLPTEDEWEYAARSGYEQKPTPYGDEMPFKYYDYSDYSDYINEIVSMRIKYNLNRKNEYKNFKWDVIYKLMYDVGSFPPTRYHLFDMGGNVKEWTYHDYAPDVYRTKDATSGVGYKVYNKIIHKEDYAWIDLGFRLVRDVDN